MPEVIQFSPCPSWWVLKECVGQGNSAGPAQKGSQGLAGVRHLEASGAGEGLQSALSLLEMRWVGWGKGAVRGSLLRFLPVFIPGHKKGPSLFGFLCLFAFSNTSDFTECCPCSWMGKEVSRGITPEWVRGCSVWLPQLLNTKIQFNLRSLLWRSLFFFKVISFL